MLDFQAIKPKLIIFRERRAGVSKQAYKLLYQVTFFNGDTF